MKRAGSFEHKPRWFFRTVLLLVYHRTVAAPEPIPKLRPPHELLPPSFWELHGWQTCAAGLGVLLVAGPITFWLTRPKKLATEPAAVRARRLLEALRKRAPHVLLAAEVSRILLRYVRAVFEFPPGELTTGEFQRALQKHPEVGSDLATSIGDLLRRCDEWKFAPVPPPRPTIVDEALALVEKIEMTRRYVPSADPAEMTSA